MSRNFLLTHAMFLLNDNYFLRIIRRNNESRNNNNNVRRMVRRMHRGLLKQTAFVQLAHAAFKLNEKFNGVRANNTKAYTTSNEMFKNSFEESVTVINGPTFDISRYQKICVVIARASYIQIISRILKFSWIFLSNINIVNNVKICLNCISHFIQATIYYPCLNCRNKPKVKLIFMLLSYRKVCGTNMGETNEKDIHSGHNRQIIDGSKW